MNLPIHSVAVQYQLDPSYPMMTATVKYHVVELDTEITFPTGDKRTFPNWDVRGSRQRFFMEEILGETSEENYKEKETCENGVRPSDVVKFCGKLAQNVRYEGFFKMKLDTPEKPKPSPKTKATKSIRKFPYVEVARLWAEGLTIREIARMTGYLGEGKSATHTMRTFLTKMHSEKGYLDADGNRVRLPYRAKRASAGA